MTIAGIGSILANLWWGITPPTDRTIALEADILCCGFLETRFPWYNINDKPFRCVLGRTQWLMFAYRTHFSCGYIDSLVWFPSYFPPLLRAALGRFVPSAFLLLRVRSKTDLLAVVIKMRTLKNGLKLPIDFLACLCRRTFGLVGETDLRQRMRRVLYSGQFVHQ